MIQQAPFCQEKCKLQSLSQAGRDWRAASVGLVLLTLGNYQFRPENIECSLGANINGVKKGDHQLLKKDLSRFTH